MRWGRRKSRRTTAWWRPLTIPEPFVVADWQLLLRLTRGYAVAPHVKLGLLRCFLDHFYDGEDYDNLV